MTTKKLIKAKLYVKSILKWNRKKHVHEYVFCNDDCLFADWGRKGTYPTKIKAEDLPEWFTYVYIHKNYGYLSAKDVKGLSYHPFYAFDNHMYKDDSLFISYSHELDKEMGLNDRIYGRDYDFTLWGSTIVDFVDAVGKYSNFDVSEIKTELEKKRAWYEEKNSKNKF